MTVTLDGEAIEDTVERTGVEQHERGALPRTTNEGKERYGSDRLVHKPGCDRLARRVHLEHLGGVLEKRVFTRNRPIHPERNGRGEGQDRDQRWDGERRCCSADGTLLGFSATLPTGSDKPLALGELTLPTMRLALSRPIFPIGP